MGFSHGFPRGLKSVSRDIHVQNSPRWSQRPSWSSPGCLPDRLRLGGLGSQPKSQIVQSPEAPARGPKRPPRGPQEAPKSPKRHPRSPEEAPKSPPRGPRGASQDPHIQEASDPPRHGDGMGRRPLDPPTPVPATGCQRTEMFTCLNPSKRFPMASGLTRKPHGKPTKELPLPPRRPRWPPRWSKMAS